MKKPLVIHLGTDHAGLPLKRKVKDFLVAAGYHVHDHGAFDVAPTDDYPDFIIPAAEAVAASHGEARGIVFGGSGLGECVAANKVDGVRAATVYDAYTAKMSRMDNDANVMCLGGRTLKTKQALKLVKIWLAAPFSGAKRHVRRLKKVSRYENKR